MNPPSIQCHRCSAWVVAPLLPIVVLAGCAGVPHETLPRVEQAAFRKAAIQVLEDAAFGDSPTGRMHAIEAFKAVAWREGMKRFAIPLNIENRYAGASFAALMAVGEIGRKDWVDNKMMETIRTRAEDPDPHVRMAALFVLHRLGDTQRTGELSELLLSNPHARVRGNAAMVIGRMGDRKHVRLLRMALRREKKAAPKLQVLASLAALGDQNAIERLIFDGYSHYADQASLALGMLADARCEDAEKLFWDRLREVSDHPEVPLQAARGLAGLGSNEGLDLALKNLFFRFPRHVSPWNPAGQEIDRVRGLAALALEAMAAPEALGALKKAFDEKGQSEYVRIAIARAAIRTIDRFQTQAGDEADPVAPLASGNDPRKDRSLK